MRRRRVSRYRRTVATGALSAALVALSVASAGADDAVPFSNGTAKATAIVSRVAPGVGSLELGIFNGVAVSEVKNDLAQAQAQSVDLGLIGTSLTSDSCPGFPDGLDPEDIPDPSRVDNRQGDAVIDSDEFPIAGTSLGGGREHAEATKQPLARAIATSAAAVFGPVVTVDGGQAEAVTEVVDGQARQATATVVADVDIAGIVTLRDMKWQAIHRTGADRVSDATFTVGEASAMSVPLGTDQLDALQTQVNTALAATGIRVEFPRVEQFEEPADLVRITPMRIVLEDSPVGKAVLGPVLNLTRAQREQMFTEIAGAICDAAAALLVGDISLSVLSGTGFLAVEIGGAEATTGELVFENPFGTLGPAPVIDLDLPPPASGVVSNPVFTPTAPGATPAPAARPAAEVGPLERVCESVHPFDWPSCSNGAAAPLGLLGIGATAGVAALDWRHQRRRRAAVTA